MAYVTPSTLPTDTFVTSTHWAIHVNNQKFLHGPPTAMVQRDAAQSFTSGAWDTLQWDTETWDTNTMWSSTNNDQVFVHTAGKYLVTFMGSFAASSAGTLREFVITKNSTAFAGGDSVVGFQTYPFDQNAGPADVTVTTLCGMVSMTTTDYITGQQFQNSGGSLASATAEHNRPRLSMLWVSS